MNTSDADLSFLGMLRAVHPHWRSGALTLIVSSGLMAAMVLMTPGPVRIVAVVNSGYWVGFGNPEPLIAPDVLRAVFEEQATAFLPPGVKFRAEVASNRIVKTNPTLRSPIHLTLDTDEPEQGVQQLSDLIEQVAGIYHSLGTLNEGERTRRLVEMKTRILDGYGKAYGWAALTEAPLGLGQWVAGTQVLPAWGDALAAEAAVDALEAMRGLLTPVIIWQEPHVSAEPVGTDRVLFGIGVAAAMLLWAGLIAFVVNSRPPE